MSTLRKIAKNTTAMIVGNIFVKILALIISISLARYLGVESFGKYTFVITYLMFFSFISGFGVDQVVIRDISRNSSVTSKMMNNALFIRSITSFIAIALSVIFINLLDYPTDTKLYITIASTILLFQGLSYLFESLFQSNLKMEYSSIAMIVSKSIFVLLVVALIYKNGSLMQLILLFVFSESIRTVISAIYSRKFTKFNFQIDTHTFKYLVKEALPFVLGSAFYIIYYRIDILMLSILEGDSAVGLYSAAYKLTDPLLFLPGALASTLMPVMSKQYIGERKNLKKTYRMGSKYIVMLMLPTTVGLYVISEKLILLLYTVEFSNSIFALQILAGTIIANSINSIQTSALAATNKQKLNLIAVAICCVINVILNIVLIPKYSYVGAALATLISVILLFSIGYYFIYKHLSMQSLNKETIKPIAASGIMGLALFVLLELNLILLIVIGVLIYTIALILLKGFTKEDLTMVRKLFGNR
ncbi:flippase [Methanococcoides alaskense]|uniref:O-antigen/teichoic acid export membrane protein n=1 Tax=Methanococcoides alaskense TaxID=325778 RepID=A0AA90U0F5_9EURY|nr:flippase [Methanococcoides alaskense]MDA0524408.1 flippase [Methanococcoides alaskense]MDR6223225.1 O-antigen/teichoic acid export membrane protein [Methanococcoides alaskense]